MHNVDARRHAGLQVVGRLLMVVVLAGWASQAAAEEDRKRPIAMSEPMGVSLESRRPAPPSVPSIPSIGTAARLRALQDAVNDPSQLLLRSDGFDPLLRRPNFPDIGPHDLTADAYPSGGKRYYIVQFTGAIQPEWFDALQQTGAKTLRYLPNNAYLVRIQETVRARLENLANVRWVGDYEPGHKIEPSLSHVISTRAPTESVKLRIATFRGISAEVLRAIVLAVDPSITIEHLHDSGLNEGRIIVSVGVAALGQLLATVASHPDVEWIEEYHLPQLFNDNSIWVIQSGNAASEATTIWDHGITGAGQVYGAADSGLDTDACQMRFGANASDQTFLDLTQPPLVGTIHTTKKVRAYYVVGAAQAYDDDTAGFHGTHTTGNAIGDNYATLANGSAGHDLGDGMAPAATVVFQDVGQHDGSLDGLLGGQTDLQQQAHDSGVRIHNNSYGVPAIFGNTDEYDLESQEVDEVMWRLQHYTLFFSAGNAGPSLGGLGLGGSTAKNTLSVGATVNGSQGGAELTDFSSHGPTSDGRFKPDLMAPGGSIVSATEDAPVGGQSQTDPPNNNCATSAASGTSFASPTLAGAGLLVRDYFEQGFYPSGAVSAPDEFDPSNALVKGILINSARDVPGQFSASDGTGGAAAHRPNFGQGWGRVTLDKALSFSGELRELIVLNDVLNGATTVVAPAATDAIQTGQTDTFILNNVSTIEDLRLTLAWSDPSGSVSAGVVLVNNLNLEVVDPNSTVFKGNVNFSNGFSMLAGAASADNLNNLENVFIKDPVPGTYTVRVIGTNVPGNGDTTPFNSNRQGYALIATGNFSFGAGPLVRFDSVSITGGKGDDEFLDRTEALDVAVTVRNHGSTDALGATVTLSVDPGSEVPASAVVISPASIEYGTVVSKSTATDTFSIALVNDVTDFSNKTLLIKVDASASGAPTTTEVFEIETMADTATTDLFDFESGITGWSMTGTGQRGGNPNSRTPNTVTCETSNTQPTPNTELKFGRRNCTSDYRDNQDQRAFSPDFSVTLANNTQLVSLNFWHRMGTEPFFDFAQVFYDHDDDGTYNFMVDFNGADMTEMRIFQAGFASFFNTGRATNQSVLFRLFTDAFVTDFPGWFVDDVSITTKSADTVSDTTPALIAASPSTGAQGTGNVTVTVTGLNTNFVNSVSAVTVSGAGISVVSTSVASSTELSANITIGAGATLGARTLTVTTGAEVVARSMLFRVVPPALSVQVTPSAWDLGTLTESSVVTSWTVATSAGGGFFTAINDGQLIEDLTIRVQSSASWSAGVSPGAETFAMGWGQTVTQGTEPSFTNITTSGVSLTQDLAVSGMFDFDLEFQAPTSTSDFSQQSIVVTVAAELP